MRELSDVKRTISGRPGIQRGNICLEIDNNKLKSHDFHRDPLVWLQWLRCVRKSAGFVTRACHDMRMDDL